MLGTRIKELREAKGLVQRQLAAELEVDTAYISKIENGCKSVSRGHLKKLASIFNISEKELTVLWLSDRLTDTIKEEPSAVESLKLTLKRVTQ